MPFLDYNIVMRIIAHLDMDAFFAAIEERDKPRLKGKPIVIGADPQDGRGRGIVSTANYVARKYGIHSAMPISQAWNASEEAKKRGKAEAVFIQGNHKKYSVVSNRIYEILEKEIFNISDKNSEEPLIERASVDEAYLNFSSLGSYGEAEIFAKKIKLKIKLKEKLTCSIGIGPNKIIAKIASDIKKPDGLTIVYPEKVESFLDPLSIRKIPGLGPKSEIFLNKKGIKLVKDLKKFSQLEMVQMMGAHGIALYKKIRGIYDAPLSSEHEAKSIGEQITFMTDTLDTSILLPALSKISESVIRSLHNDGFKSFKTVVLTVRFSDFKTKTRSRTLSDLPKTDKELEVMALQMLLPFLDKRENPKHLFIRLIGLRVEKLN